MEKLIQKQLTQDQAKQKLSWIQRISEDNYNFYDLLFKTLLTVWFLNIKNPFFLSYL